MRSSVSAGRALVAVTGLVGLVNSQSIFGSVDAELAVCTTNGLEGFAYVGCYSGLDNNVLFQFEPRAYYPGSDDQAFLGWNPGSDYDNTMTPLSCARACRGNGFKYSAVQDNRCHCGMQFPTVSAGGPVAALFSGCDTACNGDSSQTCGGRTAAQVYVDLSFADDSVIQPVPNAALASSYRYLGCYKTYQFAFQDSRVSGDGYDTVDQCFQVCAGFGYPLVAAEPRQNADTTYTGRVNCKCGTAFRDGDYRQVPESLQTPGQCSLDCTTALGTCNVSVSITANGANNRCCGTNGNYPVYINPELQGCYTPPIPGFKATGFEKVYGCYNIPRELTGQGKTSQLEVPPAGSRPLNPATGDKPALIRPPTVNTTVGNQFYLYGCYNGPAQGLAGIVNGVLTVLQTVIGDNVNTLEKCANACSAYTYFGMSNGNQCYCALALFAGIAEFGGLISRDNSFASCNVACGGAPSVACGGNGRTVVYRVNIPGVAERGAYDDYSATSLATPPPRYTCTPTNGQVVTSVVTSSVTSVVTSSVLATVTQNVTVTSELIEVQSGVTVTVDVTSVSQTTYTTQLPASTETETVAALTVTDTITTPTVLVATLTAAGSVVSVTETKEVVLTTTRVIGGRPGGRLGGPGGDVTYGEGEDCTNGVCSLSLRFGQLRLPTGQPAAGENGGNRGWAGGLSCAVQTHYWYEGATSLLPLAPVETYAPMAGSFEELREGRD